MTETLAMIEAVGVGARDVGRPILWFSVSGDGWGALQIFELADEQAVEIMSSVYDVRELNGRTCVVDKSGGLIEFRKLMPPARTKP